MSEKEKKIIEKLIEAIPKMSEFDKGYILGKTESLAAKTKDKDVKQTVTSKWYWKMFSIMYNQ